MFYLGRLWYPIESKIISSFLGYSILYKEYHLTRCNHQKKLPAYGSSHGLADGHLVQSLARMELCGLDVGDKYSPRKFVGLVEFLSAKVLEFLQAHNLGQRLPGLWVLSPVSAVFDGVSIGD